MKTINATKFKEQCLSLLERVGPEGLVITKHGKPVAKLVPVKTDFGQYIGCLEGQVKADGNVLSTGIKWDAESRHARRPVRTRRKAQARRKGGD